jgi:sporulation protein YlmC with PRC-barrel domain
VAALPREQRTFDSVVRRLALREGESDRDAEPALFLQYVSEDESIRNEAVDGDKKLQVRCHYSEGLPAETHGESQEFGLSTLSREDIYKSLLDAEQHTKANNVQLNPEEKRLMDRMIRDRKRNGLGLPQDKREELLAVKKKIMGLEVDFQRRCNEEKGSLLFSLEVRLPFESRSVSLG